MNTIPHRELKPFLQELGQRIQCLEKKCIHDEYSPGLNLHSSSVGLRLHGSVGAPLQREHFQALLHPAVQEQRPRLPRVIRLRVDLSRISLDSGRRGTTHSWDLPGRGTARAEDAQGTPTQSHTSPSILLYEDKTIKKMKSVGVLSWERKRS
jgi:hypothetical protein